METPEVRPEAVARAKALVRDTAYPPPELIDKLAALLVVRLRTTEVSCGSDPAGEQDSEP